MQHAVDIASSYRSLVCAPVLLGEVSWKKASYLDDHEGVLDSAKGLATCRATNLDSGLEVDELLLLQSTYITYAMRMELVFCEIHHRKLGWSCDQDEAKQ